MSNKQFPYIEKCTASDAFKKFLTKKELNKAVLDDAIRVVHEAEPKFDLYNIDKTDSCLRFGVKDIGSRTGKVAGVFIYANKELKLFFSKRYDREVSRRLTLTNDIEVNKKLISDCLQEQINTFKDNGLYGNGHWPVDYRQLEQAPENDFVDEEITDISAPLNQILYGPPGTGKTYHTVEAAVKVAEPNFYAELEVNLKAGIVKSKRDELTKKYRELVDKEQIRFVTFHQSYGYEEFVEGLKAKTDDDGNISYSVEDGVFKRICQDAESAEIDPASGIKADGRVWKLSIESTQKNQAKTTCLEQSMAAIGWGNTGDLSKEERNDYFNEQGKNNQNSLNYFSREMSLGDIVLCIDSNTSVEAIGVVAGDYQYNEQGLPTRPDYRHQRAVKWLAKGFSVDFKALNGNKQFNLPTCYPLSRLNVNDVLKHLNHYEINIAKKQKAINDNFVLIIDEINRGNISKIFGELITLIEPSKRAGLDEYGEDNSEALAITLPHSPDKKFTVPNNLYLIGTMNTADRSLAMMDTALRRRFDFIEMMPEPKKLAGKLVKGIDIERMLAALNKRIEVLYDREHTLGHAFFMPVVELRDGDKEKGIDANEQAAFEMLKNVFKNKITPLFEEYFFEDWNKIRLVLGDNRKDKKTQSDYIFVTETLTSYDDLFGSNHGLDVYEEGKKPMN